MTAAPHQIGADLARRHIQQRRPTYCATAYADAYRAASRGQNPPTDAPSMNPAGGSALDAAPLWGTLSGFITLALVAAVAAPLDVGNFDGPDK